MICEESKAVEDGPNSNRVLSLILRQVQTKWLEAEQWRQVLVSKDTLRRNPRIRGAYLLHCEYRKVQREQRYIEGILGSLLTVSKRGDRSLAEWINLRGKEDEAEERRREEIGRRLQAAIAGDNRRRAAKEALQILEEKERRQRDGRN